MTTNLSFLREHLAGYALGILESPEEPTLFLQKYFTNELSKSITENVSEAVDLPAELWALQVAVNHLAYGVHPMSLPTELKDRLLVRLDRVNVKLANLAELLQWSIIDLRHVAQDLPNWEPFSFISGSERVIWQVDRHQEKMAFFLRIPAAGQIPTHSHTVEESILILEGNLISDGIVYEVGNLYITAANTTHQPFTSLGCLTLNITAASSEDCSSKPMMLI
jgi:ChrR Cupin-like domain